MPMSTSDHTSILLAASIVTLTILLSLRRWVLRSSNSTPSHMSLSDDYDNSNRRPSDIYKAAVLLGRLPIPADLIPTILDFAEYTYRIQASANTNPLQIAQAQSGRIHTAARLPCGAATSLQAIYFETVSKDQGYSWDANNHNTYVGSWTWFEAGTLEDNQFNGEFNFLPSTRIDGKRICTNLHAGRDLKKHTALWRVTDDDQKIQRAFVEVRKGKPIAIAICAHFPAWVNDVRHASIAFDFQPVRKV